jgi:hypothetical protein
MAALVRDYAIERGIQFVRQITITGSGVPLDLTGATIEALIRESRYPEDIRSAVFGTGQFVQSWDTAIVGAATGGTFKISLPIAKTLAMRRGVYDYDVVILFSTGEKRRVLRGQLTVEEVVSRAD